MNSKEMFDILNTATQGRKTGRLVNIRKALSRLKMIPNYLEPVTPEGVAWSLVALATAPTSELNKAVAWIEKKDKFFRRVEAGGQLTAVQVLTNALKNPANAAEVAQVMIEKLTGMAFFHMRDGDTFRTAPVTDEQLDPDNYTFQDVVFIDGRLLVQLAEEIAVAAEMEALKQN